MRERRRRALIVENRPDWQTILARTLDSLGWEYDIANAYDEAWQLLETHPYDLATIDTVLDNTNHQHPDGIQVLLKIHRSFPAIPLIVVSEVFNQKTLKEFPELPPQLPILKKQEWDRDRFKGYVLASMFTSDDLIGKSTVVRMFRSATSPIPDTQTMPVPPAEGERGGMPRVLIVEDQPDWQVILARIVDDEGLFWRGVEDAQDALDLLRSQPTQFDVILLNLRLTDSSMRRRKDKGWRLLDYLAISDKRPRVIIVSGAASRGAVASLVTKYPIGGFVDKDSFQKNELLELIYSLASKPSIRIQTLGMFQIWRDNEALDDYGTPETETLLKVLITWRNRPVPVPDLLKLVFPTRILDNQDEVRDLLMDTIDTARRLLEPNLTMPESSAFIKRQEHGYVFDTTSNVALDYAESEQLLIRGITHQESGADEAALATYEQALPLHQGEYLPADRFAQWTVPLRNHLQSMYARMLNRMADLYAKRGDFEQAIQTAELCMQQDPYHESTHRRLMRYHSCNGNREAALTVYLTLEKQRREFFGEEPSPETQALYEAIKAGETISCVEQSLTH